MNTTNSLGINESLNDYVTSDVIVVGAGVSGLTVAKALQLSGSDICVFEKARGTGGRLGSKRIILERTNNEVNGINTSELDLSASFDLGASSFTANTKKFNDYLQNLMQQGLVATTDAHNNRYVAVPRNSMLTRHLSKDIGVSFSTKITRIEHKDGKWFLFGESQTDTRQPQAHSNAANSGSNNQPPSEDVIACCKHLILSAPAEQTRQLLPSEHAARSWVGYINSDPAHVSCLIFTPNTLTSDHLNKLHNYSDDVIDNVTLEHTKPDRKYNSYQIIKLTTTTQWSQKHLDESHSEIESKLLQLVYELLNISSAKSMSVIKQYTHRWLFSQYSNLIKGTKGYLSFSDNLHIVGDYFDIEAVTVEKEELPCVQSIEGVERAFISAQRLASHLQESGHINRECSDTASSVSI
jgi:renalase